MAPGTLIDALPSTPHPGACTGLDTIRALCHDLRQPLAAIQLLASVQGGVQGGAQGSEVRHRLDLILEQVLWLSQMVEGVIGEAAEDQPERVDVADLASHAVMRAQPTATCHIGFAQRRHTPCA